MHWLDTLVAGCTLIVFAVTAAIALVQLGHLWASYQMTSAALLLQSYWSPGFQEWLRFCLFDLQGRLEEPAYREELGRVPIDKTRHPEVYVCEYYALIGAYMKRGLMPARGEIFLDLGGRDAINAWQSLWPAVELMRRSNGPTLYEDFEYLAVLSQRWLDAHPHGSYPRTFPRFKMPAASATPSPRATMTP